MIIDAVLDEACLKILKEILPELGAEKFTVETSDSDLSAIQKMFIRQHGDFLLLDIDLKSVLGASTIEELRGQMDMNTLGIVVISASSDLIEECVDSGADAGVQKPFTDVELKSTLRRVLFSKESGEGKRDPRKSSRRALESPCLISTAKGKIRGILKDISILGARVVVKEELELGTFLKLTVAVPGSSPLSIINFKAEVVRDSGEGYGLAFKSMDQSTRAFLNTFTKKS